MSVVYLVRHGQAGPRNDYDRLSDVGHEQTRRLGVHLANSPQRFVRAVSGTLRRQRETAENAMSLMADKPEWIVDPRWDEFDLDAVYREIGPKLAAEDPRFRALYEEIMACWDDPESQYHRAHSPADGMVVRAWVAGKYQSESESWVQFTERIRSATDDLAQLAADGPVLVFTSATPKTIALSHAIGAELRELFGLLGSLYNSSVSELARQGNGWQIVRQNTVPHLTDPDLLTLR